MIKQNTLKIDGINLEFLNSDLLKSEKPLLIFLHEGLGSIGQWKSFPKIIAQKLNFPALLYDRIGYGKSDFWTEDLKADLLQDEAQRLNKLIDKLEIKNDIILFGHSDGATIALLNAAMPHKNLLAVIAEAPHIILEDVSFQGIENVKKLIENKKFITKLQKYHGNRTKELVSRWTNLWLSQKDKNYDLSDYMKKIIHPICLIQGDNDHFASFKQLDLISENVKSKFVDENRIQDCGHIPHLEKTNEIEKIALEFIEKILNFKNDML